ncbi:hypothetical protein Dd586_0218 [Dickeya parazeae Ech586]|uniref:Uncharacterized protein n=1 Tax=Dickeya zeae (strain Ech586) TaxID=590409 RepID=D2C1F4_DICZ5|nr:hypothetical protein Dd586_0218 [Dickeya parazeae Ech586]
MVDSGSGCISPCTVATVASLGDELSGDVRGGTQAIVLSLYLLPFSARCLALSALLLRCSIRYRLLMATKNCLHPGELARCLPVDCYLTGAVLFLLVAAAARRASAGGYGEEEHAG